MKRPATILMYMALFMAINAVAQDSVNSKDIVGKWLLIKHVVTIRGVTKQYPLGKDRSIYQFYENGRFKFSSKKILKKEFVIKGKWNLVDGSGEMKIHFQSLEETTSNPVNIIQDYDIEILKLSKQDLLLEEYMFSEEIPGTSYFKKVK